jgi:hypothetical protein
MVVVMKWQWWHSNGSDVAVTVTLTLVVGQ